MLSYVIAVLRAVQEKVDHPDAFPLGASVWKESMEAYVKIMT